MPRSPKIWFDRHISDPWVKAAQKDRYRSRAAYKLLEIHQKYHLFKAGQLVVDLGASPGSWSQVARFLVGRKGRVLAIDLLPMQPIEGVEFLLGDFSDLSIVERLVLQMDGQKAALIISDMAPNISGNRVHGQYRIFDLARQALFFCKSHLVKGGVFLIKVFQGDDFLPYCHLLRESFEIVATSKPQASRSFSREIFLIAKGKL